MKKLSNNEVALKRSVAYKEGWYLYSSPLDISIMETERSIIS